MISEELELRMKRGRVSHSWCMCVVGHGYGGLGGGRDGVVDGMHAGQGQGGWLHVGRCRSISRVQSDTPMTPDHTVVQVHGHIIDNTINTHTFTHTHISR